MDKIIIRGGRRLVGDIQISGAKNAALPLMAASLLTDQPLVLKNLPRLADIDTMGELLAGLGVSVTHSGGSDDILQSEQSATLHARVIASTTAPYDLVVRMRASVLVLGPLVARCGEARVSLPGGCAIGTRPIDLHLMGLEDMGAEIELSDGYVTARAPGGLKGADIHFPSVSVGATENLLMTACLARGRTRLMNAAREPEIGDLANCLIAMGAKIDGIGTDCLVIAGGDGSGSVLQGAEYRVLPDRIEAGSYALAAAMTGGDIRLLGARRDDMEALIGAMTLCGADIQDIDDKDGSNEDGSEEGGLRVRAPASRLRGHDVITAPHPGFPTDMQAQFMAMMAIADGTSLISETIFENRFMHVPELGRMGADIHLEGGLATVHGKPSLRGAEVMATDLRASMSLVLAGLAAEGETVINRVYHLDRGYEHLEKKLIACGADIRRVK